VARHSIRNLWRAYPFTNRSAPLAKSVAKTRFEPRAIKVRSGWLVVVRFPDRPEIEVPGFSTEADAKNWVTNDSSAWLQKLGYGD
jgi:hypothetical protein